MNKNKSFSDMVQEFMTAAEQINARHEGDNLDGDEFVKQLMLYKKLIDEEYEELNDSITGTDHWVKESCDLIWVIIARMLTFGVDVNMAFTELHRSNMSKTVDGKVIRRKDGKILKPECYSDADMRHTLHCSVENTRNFTTKLN